MISAAIDYFANQEKKAKWNMEQAKKNGARKEQLENIYKKMCYYQLAQVAIGWMDGWELMEASSEQITL